MGELKKTIKIHLKQEDSYKKDPIFHTALVRFYDDAIKKRAGFKLPSNGMTYGDIMQIFINAAQAELKIYLESETVGQSDPIATERALLRPFTTIEDALASRIQEFISWLKSSVEKACTEEMVQYQQQAAKKHKRNFSGADHGHHRNPSTSTKDGVARIADSVQPSIPEESSSTTNLANTGTICLLEWLKDAFRISREVHEKALHECQADQEPKVNMDIRINDQLTN
jgi:hypothetical protein